MHLRSKDNLYLQGYQPDVASWVANSYRTLHRGHHLDASQLGGVTCSAGLSDFGYRDHSSATLVWCIVDLRRMLCKKKPITLVENLLKSYI